MARRTDGSPFQMRSPRRASAVRIGELAGAIGKRPFVGVGQYREALHRRAVETLADHLIERERAALACSRAIGKCDRRRIELARHRGLRVPSRTVATGAILREERRPASEIGDLPWTERHRIGPKQVRAQRPSGLRDRFRRGLVLDQRLERPALSDQFVLRRIVRERSNPFARRGRKLAHFRIFRSADDLPVANRTAVIDREIIEQAPGRLSVIRLRRQSGRTH